MSTSLRYATRLGSGGLRGVPRRILPDPFPCLLRRRHSVQSSSSTSSSSSRATHSKDSFPHNQDDRIHLPRYYKYLRLESFRPDELERRYQEIVQDDDALTADNLQPYLLQRIQDLEQENSLPSLSSEDDACLDARRRAYAAMEADQFLRLFPTLQQQQQKQQPSVSQADFLQTMHDLAIRVDYQRTAPIFSSMLLVGLSVG